MKKITIIDYGYGNIYSLVSVLKYIGLDPLVSKDPEKIKYGDIIFLPGVGAFKSAMQQLLKFNMDDAIKFALNRGSFLIGICLGYQMLFEESEEFGTFNGLGLLRGKVVNLKNYRNKNFRIPNVGWHPLKKYSTNSHRLSFFEGDLVYFVHSYIPVSYDKKIISSCIEYGNDLLHTSVESDQIMGFQFHPEKSGEVGIKILDKLIRRL